MTRISNNEAVEWIVDHEGQHGVNALFNSILPGYSTNGNNLIVENIIMNDGRNNSEYRCVIVLQVTSTIQRESNHTILYVAGEYTIEYTSISMYEHIMYVLTYMFVHSNCSK